jgi:hypothetical protein
VIDVEFRAAPAGKAGQETGSGLWTKRSSGSGQTERFPGEFEAKGLKD